MPLAFHESNVLYICKLYIYIYICNRRLVRVHVARLAFRPRQRRSYSPAFAVLANTHTHTPCLLASQFVTQLQTSAFHFQAKLLSCPAEPTAVIDLSPPQRDAGKKEAGAPFGYGRAICFLLIRSRGTAAQQAGTAEHGKQQRSHAVLCCLLWPVLWVLRALTQAAGWHHGMHSAIQGWCSPVRYVLRS